MTLIEAKVDANGCSLCETFNEEISYFNKPNRSAIYSDWYNQACKQILLDTEKGRRIDNKLKSE